jgi:tRNA dimethylallyltransferase
MVEKNKIIVILGPTASGKSDIAVKLAKKINGEIISADSRQVYKGLDIGTGKITKKETRGVKHYLLDVINPKKQFTASDFKKLAEKAIQEILNKNKVPIICGGTGFYIDALLGDKQIPEIPPNPKLRERLEKKSTEELFEILKKLNPERAENIDAKNPRRLIRAIEICKAIGKVPPLDQTYAEQSKYKVLKIGVKPEEEKLKERIHRRLIARVKKGMVKEADNLHKEGLSWKRMISLGLEYKYLALLLQKKISKGDFINQLNLAIQHYAKRQITWFKRDKKISWFKSEDFLKIATNTRNFLNLE